MSSASGEARAKGWRQDAKEYWSHQEYGRVMKEWNGWKVRLAKPFKTMSEAMEFCEKAVLEGKDE